MLMFLYKDIIFILFIFRQWLKTLANKKIFLHEDINLNDNNNNNINNQLIWFVIPYKGLLSEQFKNIIKDTISVISFYNMNKLGNIIRAQKKDPLPANCKKNVVYKISCKDWCDLSDKSEDNWKREFLTSLILIITTHFIINYRSLVIIVMISVRKTLKY